MSHTNLQKGVQANMWSFFLHTELTEIHRICSADTLLTEEHKNIFFSRKVAKRYVLLFLCKKSLHTGTHRTASRFALAPCGLEYEYSE